MNKKNYYKYNWINKIILKNIMINNPLNYLTIKNNNNLKNNRQSNLNKMKLLKKLIKIIKIYFN